MDEDGHKVAGGRIQGGGELRTVGGAVGGHTALGAVRDEAWGAPFSPSACEAWAPPSSSRLRLYPLFLKARERARERRREEKKKGDD